MSITITSHDTSIYHDTQYINTNFKLVLIDQYKLTTIGYTMHRYFVASLLCNVLHIKKCVMQPGKPACHTVNILKGKTKMQRSFMHAQLKGTRNFCLLTKVHHTVSLEKLSGKYEQSHFCVYFCLQLVQSIIFLHFIVINCKCLTQSL